MGVNVFDKLYDLVSEENRDNAALLKSFKKEDYDSKIVELDSAIKSETKKFDKLKKDKDQLETERAEVQKQLLLLESKIKSTVEVIDLEKVKQELSTIFADIQSISVKKTKMVEQLGKAEEIVMALKTAQSTPTT